MPSTTIQPSPTIGLLALLENTRVALPLKQLDIDARITGDVVSVQLDQVYLQDNSRPLDCTYTFPLPPEAAVHRCELHVALLSFILLLLICFFSPFFAYPSLPVLPSCLHFLFHFFLIVLSLSSLISCYAFPLHIHSFTILYFFLSSSFTSPSFSSIQLS